MYKAGMSFDFARGCELVPSVIEIGNYLVEREPETLGVYSVTQHTADIFQRVKTNGFERKTYTIGKGKLDEEDGGVVTAERLLGIYSATPFPLPDIVTQYEIYRARDCSDTAAYPGSLVYTYHQIVTTALTTTPQKQLYLGAMLAVDPLDLFVVGRNPTKSVERLMKEIDELQDHLRNDLDVRVAW